MLDRGESDDKAKNCCSHFLALLTQSYSPEQISSDIHNDGFPVNKHDFVHNISEITGYIDVANKRMLVTSSW